jgi:hypothetical protein
MKNPALVLVHAVFVLPCPTSVKDYPKLEALGFE